MSTLLWIPLLTTFCLFLFARYLCSTRFVLLLSQLAILFSILLSIIYYISDQITGDGINDATLFHLSYGLGGINPLDYPSELILVLAGLALAGWLIFRLSRRSAPLPPWSFSVVTEFTIFSALLCFSVIVHPAMLDMERLIQKNWTISNALLLDKELVVPPDIVPAFTKKTSLVYLYVEGLERTFFDEGIFPGLVTDLKELEKGALSIRGIRQAPMTEWTIAGMVSSQCGVPLATFKPNRNDLSTVERFIPGATCLGDILALQGYRNVYIGGADISFAGKNRFYQEHGFYELIGLNEIQVTQPQPLPVSRWGIFDDALLEIAFGKYKELSSQELPFALFLLTLDTHPPIGHVSPACESVIYGDGQSKILNAIKCADGLIANFIRKIDECAYENGQELIIVVASDHLMMKSDTSALLDANAKKRENLFMVLSSDLTPGMIEREGSTLDIAPTTLAVLGWDIEAMALGRNLLKPGKTLVEKYGEASFFDMVQSWRMSLWRNWVPKSE